MFRTMRVLYHAVARCTTASTVRQSRKKRRRRWHGAGLPEKKKARHRRAFFVR
jgi:hypothetical protein